MRIHSNPSTNLTAHSDTSTTWPPPSTAVDLPTFQAMLDGAPALRSAQGSVPWRVNRERVLLLGWGRAILMQFAHPSIAEAVAEHSYFAGSFKSRLTRLQHTLGQMLTLTFGTTAEVWQAAQHIDQVHARINGHLAGAPEQRYTARDPALMKWVHATFVESTLLTYERFVGPLSRSEKESYLQGASILGPLLGAPPGYFPADVEALNAYIQDMLDGGVLQVGSRAKELTDSVFAALPVPLLGPALTWGVKTTTSVLLPPSLRAAYGYAPSSLDVAVVQGAARVSRRLHRILPASVHCWRAAREAERRGGG